ncbi:DENN domain-containing protein 2A isoform X2 [Lingula anatina]|uniref:DENN domain-containing protein 2A isoform X2 n=1 Tax=Lingula anatina TaxID=7574 RepID=A0A1S3JAA9_LINAN|nr:DENN domain-containing protein 2A isoform X2 [Lingula anatina]|eukprot:XP_013407258.1 DENN domain-containing protein 2A isoform X2 [Lingula anatina]
MDREPNIKQKKMLGQTTMPSVSELLLKFKQNEETSGSPAIKKTPPSPSGFKPAITSTVNKGNSRPSNPYVPFRKQSNTNEDLEGGDIKPSERAKSKIVLKPALMNIDKPKEKLQKMSDTVQVSKQDSSNRPEPMKLKLQGLQATDDDSAVPATVSGNFVPWSAMIFTRNSGSNISVRGVKNIVARRSQLFDPGADPVKQGQKMGGRQEYKNPTPTKPSPSNNPVVLTEKSEVKLRKKTANVDSRSVKAKSMLFENSGEHQLTYPMSNDRASWRHSWGSDIITNSGELSHRQSRDIILDKTPLKPRAASDTQAVLINHQDTLKETQQPISAISVKHLPTFDQKENDPSIIESKKVEKVSTHKLTPENDTPEIKDSTYSLGKMSNVKNIISSCNGKTLEVPHSTAKPMAPPPKPPRTFEHDNYKMKSYLSLKPDPVSHTSASDHEYEEIEEYTGDNTAVFHHNNRPLPVPPPRPPLLQRHQGTKRDRFSIEIVNSQEKSIANKSPGRERHRNVKEEWKPIHLSKPDRDDSLKRYASDEFIYSEPQLEPIVDSYISGSPFYVDPMEHMSIQSGEAMKGECGLVDRQVKLDKSGYAIPESNTHVALKGSRSLENNVVRRNSSRLKERRAKLPDPMENEKLFFKNMHNYNGTDAPVMRRKLPQVKQKVRQAFSILRRAVKSGIDDDQEEEHIYDEALSDDTDSIYDEQEVQKKLTYVLSLKEKKYATLERTKEFQEKIYPQLFEYAMIVELQPGADGMMRPCVTYRFPPTVEERAAIPQFCFPDAQQMKPMLQYESESFSFVLTSEDGTRDYGFCRRVLPPGSEPRLPVVYCIISPLGAFGLYTQLLEVMDIIHSTQQDSRSGVTEFIQAAFGKPLPSPGKLIRIRHMDENGEIETLELKRRSDNRLEHVNYNSLFQHLGILEVVKVFASVLLERRILFCANKLSTLTACVQAITALLYPFTWQHTYISVLPDGLIDICCSPTPYIIGILSAFKDQLDDLPLEEVLIVDLDSGHLENAIGDEEKILPKKCQKALIMALEMGKEDVEIASNLMISESFMRFFVETVGHFEDHIGQQQDGEVSLQKEAFSRAADSKTLRMFLRWFCETQLFEVFVRQQEEEQSEFSLFKTRIAEYKKELEEMGPSFRDNVKDFGNKVKNLGKHIKKAFVRQSSEN